MTSHRSGKIPKPAEPVKCVFTHIARQAVTQPSGKAPRVVVHFMYPGGTTSICRAGYDKSNQSACTPLDCAELPDQIIGDECKTCRRQYDSQQAASQRTPEQVRAFGESQTKLNDERRLATLKAAMVYGVLGHR